MPFGLTNAPATFQHLMNSILRPYLDKFVIVYLDDILIYSNNLNEHLVNLKQVFDVLRQNELIANPDKCNFLQEQVEFLGHLVTKNGLQMDPKKLEAIRNWPLPLNTIKEIRGFLGITSYYRKYINNFAHPITQLLKKGTKLTWTDEHQKAAEILIQRMMEEPILRLPDFNLPFEVTTDASDFAVGAVLTQDDGQGHRPVAYESRKLNDAERNYSTYEKEMLAIVNA